MSDEARTPLLMIPGPIEVSPRVLEAMRARPPGHMAKPLVEAFGRALRAMRPVWKAPPESRPLVVAGSGTTAMELAIANLVEPGTRVCVVCTGYFSDRMVEMITRHGGEVVAVRAEPGDAPSPAEVAAALDAGPPCSVLVATHVDTSTGVRIDPAPFARLARERGLLSVFDGVCATGAERFEMAAWDADIYLTGSQKALGLPPGLALLVLSQGALEARARRRTPVPLSLDWDVWLPVMRGYEDGAPTYFATPATSLVLALDVGLAELLELGIDARVAAHVAVAARMNEAWRALGLRTLPVRPELTAGTLSALHYPDGVDAALVARVLERGVIIAGGLHPALKTKYFRVGHMGWVTTQPALLDRTVDAVREALAAR